MMWIEHILDILGLLICACIVAVLPTLYACVVVGSRADAHMERRIKSLDKS